jgi:hypothetical protein
VTIKRLTSKAAVLPAAATAAARTPLHRLILLASLVLAIAALSPSAALAAANGTARPLTGTGTGTTTLNLVTGAATADFTGHLSHLGAETGHDDLTVTVTSASTFVYTGTETFVAANGDKLFSTVMGSGTVTPTAIESTDTDTITGGTGRFSGASGTYTKTASVVVVSITATSETTHFTAAAEGQISY